MSSLQSNGSNFIHDSPAEDDDDDKDDDVDADEVQRPDVDFTRSALLEEGGVWWCLPRRQHLICKREWKYRATIM